MATERKQIMVRLLATDADAIHELAVESNRSSSNYIDWLVRNHLKELRDSGQIDF